jgi:hypothetical protein
LLHHCHIALITAAAGCIGGEFQLYGIGGIAAGSIESIAGARGHYRDIMQGIDLSHYGNIRIVKICYIEGETAVSSVLTYYARPGICACYRRATVGTAAFVGTYGRVRPSCLAAIAKIARRAGAYVIHAGAPILAGGGTALILAAGGI